MDLFRQPKLYYVNNWPLAKNFGGDVLIIYDRIFDQIPPVRAWVRSFSARYAVKSGESLKDVDSFSGHIKAIERATRKLSSRNLKIVVLGGGSVGDFGGFVASVFKRGVELIHFPSTWLAAIDSAHGGKTALNVSGIKNQIGTFYPATAVYMVKPLLMSQPLERTFEALGELIKMGLLAGGDLYSRMSRVSELDSKALWRLLPLAVRAKYRIVNRDPRERTGERHLLNLGHTMGHVFEAHYGLPHGVAVLAGVQFSLEWSYQRGILSQKEYLNLMRAKFWQKAVDKKMRSPWRHLSMLGLLGEMPRTYLHYLQQDKKKSEVRKLRFVFLKKPGAPIIASVDFKEILTEISRQNSFWG